MQLVDVLTMNDPSKSCMFDEKEGLSFRITFETKRLSEIIMFN